MKVVIVGPSYPLRAGGMCVFNQRMAREFQNQGHQVTILTFKLQYPNFLFPGKTQWSDEEAPSDLTIDVAINSVNPINWINVGRKYKKIKPDLVVFRYWMPFMAPSLGTIARIIASNKHSRCVAITDNIVPHEKRVGDAVLTNYFLKSIHACLAMSRSVLEDINKFNTDKPRVYTPHPLYDEFGAAVPKAEAKQKLGLDPNTNFLLFFGIIRSYKGLDLLLKSLVHIDMDNLNLKLIIAGEFYVDRDYYLNLIAELGLKDKLVLHTDFIPTDKVALYFSAADLVAQTYKTATQSGVTQIAYYYEKPMLVTNVGGLAELVPDKKVGYVVEVDEKAIADAITDFYTQNRAEAMQINLAEERKKYSWELFIEKLIQL